jgi:hypothetical protein
MIDVDCHRSRSLSLGQTGFDSADVKTCGNHADPKLRQVYIPGHHLTSKLEVSL